MHIPQICVWKARQVGIARCNSFQYIHKSHVFIIPSKLIHWKKSIQKCYLFLHTRNFKIIHIFLQLYRNQKDYINDMCAKILWAFQTISCMRLGGQRKRNKERASIQYYNFVSKEKTAGKCKLMDNHHSKDSKHRKPHTIQAHCK